MAKLVIIPDEQPQEATKSKARLITIPDSSELKTHNQGMGKPTTEESSQYTERSPTFREAIGKDIPSVLSTIGSFAGPEGGAAGAFFGEGLRSGFPNQFGGPDSGNVGTDLLANTALPTALNSVSKFAAGPKQYIADKLASIFGQKLPAVKNLMGGVKDFEDTTHQLFSDVVDKSSQAYQDATKEAELNYRKKIFGAKNPMVNDPNVQTPPGFKLPDPNNFTPRSSDLPENYTGFTSAEPNLDQVKQIIQKVSANNDVKNPLLRYSRNRLIFSLGALASGASLGIAPTAAVGGSVLLGNAAIKQLTKDPEIASLLIKAIKTPSDAEQSGLISKTLLNAIRGTAVTVLDAEGNETPAQVSKDGQLQYQRK